MKGDDAETPPAFLKSSEQYEEVLEEIRQELKGDGYTDEQIAWHEAAARAQTA